MMHWSHPRIARGAVRQLPGCSVVDMRDDRIVRQRDYYDAGEMIYEHLPILGCRARREAESEIMKTVLITGASSGIGRGWRNLLLTMVTG